MPLREIRRKFTVSELVVMGWRANELDYNFKMGTNPDSQSQPRRNRLEDYTDDPEAAKAFAQRAKSGKKRKEVNGILPEGLPDHLFNEEGELDLRKATQEEAWKFFAAQGIKLPIMPRGH